ncbi:uncharacterized protein EAE98_010979 [Botrytis deweyae]|uniref:Uncharacterized protein n=1 Tax=Botrytis deweyae TaxID=2478750 RepID=A0ABQ7I780_9HELO|nr:uncharacterized protein EAE98_010979 [Botrytis deweyae]KAF7915636.1 hypothetical protein EAE98_010979 [Botrytis deweyae]
MFEFITSFFSTAAPPLFPPSGPTVTVLIIPANGAPPRIERLGTVNVRNDGRIDRFLHYVPDMRPYWKNDFGWSCRDIARIDITNHVVPALNGFYYGFKSYDVYDLPMSKHGRGIYGDACITKMAPEKYCARGFRIIKWGEEEIDDLKNELSRFAVYDDITMDVVDTGLWKELVEKLSKV